MCVFMNEINNEWKYSIGAAVIKLKVTHGKFVTTTLYANLKLDKVGKGRNVG